MRALLAAEPPRCTMRSRSLGVYDDRPSSPHAHRERGGPTSGASTCALAAARGVRSTGPSVSRYAWRDQLEARVAPGLGAGDPRGRGAARSARAGEETRYGADPAGEHHRDPRAIAPAGSGLPCFLGVHRVRPNRLLSQAPPHANAARSEVGDAAAAGGPAGDGGAHPLLATFRGRR